MHLTSIESSFHPFNIYRDWEAKMCLIGWLQKLHVRSVGDSHPLCGVSRTFRYFFTVSYCKHVRLCALQIDDDDDDDDDDGHLVTARASDSMFLCIDFVRVTNCFYDYDYDYDVHDLSVRGITIPCDLDFDPEVTVLVWCGSLYSIGVPSFKFVGLSEDMTHFLFQHFDLWHLILKLVYVIARDVGKLLINFIGRFVLDLSANTCQTHELTLWPWPLTLELTALVEDDGLRAPSAYQSEVRTPSCSEDIAHLLCEH